MAVYLGSKKVTVRFNGTVCRINIPSLISEPVIDSIRLLSSDDCILKDSNGFYLIPKNIAPYNVAISSDDYILQDSNKQYITLKEYN